MQIDSATYDGALSSSEDWRDNVFRFCGFSHINSDGALVESAFLNCEFRECDFYWGSFSQAIFVNTKFVGCKFRGCSFAGAQFVECEFIDCQLLPDNFGKVCAFDDCRWYACKQYGSSEFAQHFVHAL